jgi:hypothetical protein
MSPGCGLAILAFLALEGTALWASINGWWIEFVIGGGAVALSVAVGVVNRWFTRKVDSLKGPAPRDRVRPVELCPPESKTNNLLESPAPPGPTSGHGYWSEHFPGSN